MVLSPIVVSGCIYILYVRKGAIWSAASRKILDGIRSGPMAFEMSSFFKSLLTPGSVTTSLSMSCTVLFPISGMLFMSSSVKTLSYCSFSISAFPLLSMTSLPVLSLSVDMLTVSFFLDLMYCQNFLPIVGFFSSLLSSLSLFSMPRIYLSWASVMVLRTVSLALLYFSQFSGVSYFFAAL